MFKIYEGAEGNTEIFTESFEMLEVLKDAIKKGREAGDSIEHVYNMIPPLLDYIRGSSAINFGSADDIHAVFESIPSQDDEVEKFKNYRMFATDHLRK